MFDFSCANHPSVIIKNRSKLKTSNTGCWKSAAKNGFIWKFSTVADTLSIL